MLELAVLGVGLGTIGLGSACLWVSVRLNRSVHDDREEVIRLQREVDSNFRIVLGIGREAEAKLGVTIRELDNLRSLKEEMDSLGDALDRMIDGHLQFEETVKILTTCPVPKPAPAPAVLPFRPGAGNPSRN